MLRLGVNIDHVATIRNARGGALPDPVRAAHLAVSAGADGITAHRLARGEAARRWRTLDELAPTQWQLPARSGGGGKGGSGGGTGRGRSGTFRCW